MIRYQLVKVTFTTVLNKQPIVSRATTVDTLTDTLTVENRVELRGSVRLERRKNVRDVFR